MLGIPAMLAPDDYLHDGPDELSVLLYVGLLSCNLLRLTVERRAALTIIDYLRKRLCWRPSESRSPTLHLVHLVRHAELCVRICCGVIICIVFNILVILADGTGWDALVRCGFGVAALLTVLLP